MQNFSLKSLSLGMLMLASLASAQQPGTEPAKPSMPKARMLDSQNQIKDVFIVESGPSNVRYKETEIQTNVLDKPRSQIITLFLYEPQSWREAYEQYRNANYKEALEGFAKVKQEQQATAALQNNYVTLARFYELECMRRLGDYAGLKAGLEKIDVRLLGEGTGFTRQLEILQVFSALGSKEYPRLIKLGEKLLTNENFNPSQRVAVNYCLGVAYQETKDINNALNHLAFVLSGDGGSSRVMMKDAILRMLDIYDQHPEVQSMLKLAGTEDQPPVNSLPDIMTKEAGNLARSYKEVFFRGEELPEKYAKYLKYAQKRNNPNGGGSEKPADEAKSEPAKDAKPEPAKAN